MATGDVALLAGGDMDIRNGVDTHTEEHSVSKKKSGVFATGNGSIGATAGERKSTQTQTLAQYTAAAGIVASNEGNVTLVADGDVSITGSDVFSKTGTMIVGDSVTIAHAEESQHIDNTTEVRQSGLNVSIKGAAVEYGQVIYNAGKRSNDVEDDRLKAAYAGQAAYAAYDAYQNVATGGTTGSAQAGGINLRIGYGASKTTTESRYTETTARGSQVLSDGNVTIAAREGDLRITGSDVSGLNVGLSARNDLIIESARETSEQRSRNKHTSGEVGVFVGTESMGVYASAGTAQGRGDGATVSYRERHVQADELLGFSSGGDTRIEGGQLLGETVVGQVGGNLSIISQQDSERYRRKDEQASGEGMFGVMGGSGSASYQLSEISHDYLSVREQSGIQAGEGGFQIRVEGHTDLVGGALASTADASKNSLDTGSLSVSDLKNSSEFDAYSVGISVSGGGGASSRVSPSAGIPQDEQTTSTTRAGIADGTIIIRDGDESALASVARGVTELQQEGLKSNFDEQKVNELLELGQVAGAVTFRAVGDIATWKQKEAADRYTQAQAAYDAAMQSGDQAGMATAMLEMDAALKNYTAWADGSANKTALHVLAGALQAALGGGDALSGALGAGSSEYVAGATGNDILGFVAGAITGATSGSASTGLATSATGYTYNKQLHEQERKALDTLIEAGINRAAIKCGGLRCGQVLGIATRRDGSGSQAADRRSAGQAVPHGKAGIAGCAARGSAGDVQVRIHG